MNYMGYQEEGSVYELPWEYECSNDTNSVLTKEQYQAIVSTAEWLPEERIRLHKKSMTEKTTRKLSALY